MPLDVVGVCVNRIGTVKTIKAIQERVQQTVE